MVDEVTQTIIRVFSYTEREQEVFPYLKKYMSKIEHERMAVLASEKGRERYMLAGLFLTYRACIHIGKEMSTSAAQGATHHHGGHSLRLATYKTLSGKDIENIPAYLSALGLLYWWQFLLWFFVFSPDLFLVRFVKAALPHRRRWIFF